MVGTIINKSSRRLWIVETDSGKAIAHLLLPQQKTPSNVDADGAKAEDGTLIDDHASWIKVRTGITLTIEDKGSALTYSCGLVGLLPSICYAVPDGEFGKVTYDHDPGWGVSL